MPQCAKILDSFFLISGFKKSCISDVFAPLKEWTFTLLVPDKIHPFTSLIIESPAIRISGFDSFALLSLETFSTAAVVCPVVRFLARFFLWLFLLAVSV